MIVPVSREAANRFIAENHSHHGPVRADIIRCGWSVDGKLVGVVIGALPNARKLCEGGLTLEVSRLCTVGTKNAGSSLLSAITKAGIALGYRRFVSYTRIDEPGTVYRAAGWWPTHETEPGDWNTMRNSHRGLLPGIYVPATEVIARVRWEFGPDAKVELGSVAHLGRRIKPSVTV